MGLDIFFSKKSKEQEEAVEVGYFRKVNFLVSFFTEYGFDDDTQEAIVIDKDMMTDLLSRCNRVLEADSQEKAFEIGEEILPTREGFFYGSTDYDEVYLEKVANVKEYCTELLDMMNEEPDAEFTFCIWA